MKRSIKKAIEEGRKIIAKNNYIDISFREIEEVISSAKRDCEKFPGGGSSTARLFIAIGLAFDAGIAIGRQYEKKTKQAKAIQG